VPLITSSQFGIGFVYLVELGESSVITWVGLGDLAKSGFWEGVRDDDRGGSSVLSVVICEAGRAELELGGPRVGHRDAELGLGGFRGREDAACRSNSTEQRRLKP
jgi:hypothetical protein